MPCSDSQQPVLSEFVILVAKSWATRLPAVLTALQALGADVRFVAGGTRVIGGVVERGRIEDLSRLPCVRHLTEGTPCSVDVPQPKPDGHAPADRPQQQRLPTRTGHATRRCRDRRRRLHSSPHLLKSRRPRRGSSPASESCARPSFPPCRRLLALAPFADSSFAPAEGAPDRLRRLLFPPIDDDEPACPARHDRRLPIPTGVRLAYMSIVVLGIALVARALNVSPATTKLAQANGLVFGTMLISVAALASAGLCRLRAICHICICIGFWLTISPCFLSRPFSVTNLILGLMAFLTAGCASDAMHDLIPQAAPLQELGRERRANRI